MYLIIECLILLLNPSLMGLSHLMVTVAEKCPQRSNAIKPICQKAMTGVTHQMFFPILHN